MTFAQRSKLYVLFASDCLRCFVSGAKEPAPKIRSLCHDPAHHRLPPKLSFVKEAPPYTNESGRKERQAVFRCDCGAEKIILIGHVTSQKIVSCGCHKKEQSTKHGMRNHPSYAAWSGMMHRCKNKKSPEFKRYGGRGIQVCKRWENVENFVSDMGERPTDKHQIDRRDNNGNYEPENCRWVTAKDNARNTRISKRWFVCGASYESSRQAANCLGVSCSTIMRWCDGNMRSGKFYPPKENCYSEQKYKLQKPGENND